MPVSLEKEEKISTTETIYWAFQVTYRINNNIYTSSILIASTQLNHTVNILASVTHKTMAIPPKVVMAITALAANDAVWVC